MPPPTLHSCSCTTIQKAPLPKPLCSLHHDTCNPQPEPTLLVGGFIAGFAMCSFAIFQQLLFSDGVKSDFIYAAGGWTCLPLIQTGVHQ